ncbi:hypothetical protein ACVWYF_000263 [Hymenobacter sp. UYAg731]
MYKPLALACLAAIIPSQKLVAQEEPWVIKDVLILQSTKDYKAALISARQAAARLHILLDLKGYRPNAQSGLTMSKTVCADNGFEYPTYLARGREMEDAAYVSIEYSTGYNGFAKGFYLVVAAVGESGSPVVRNTSTAAHRWYNDAYAKRTQVWLGCIH